VVDQLLLYCYHYDPEKGKYSAIVMRIVRLAGVATMFFLGILIFWLVRSSPVQGLQGAQRVR